MRVNLINDLWKLRDKQSLLQLEIQRRAVEFLNDDILFSLKVGTYNWLNDALL